MSDGDSDARKHTASSRADEILFYLYISRFSTWFVLLFMVFGEDLSESVGASCFIKLRNPLAFALADVFFSPKGCYYKTWFWIFHLSLNHVSWHGEMYICFEFVVHILIKKKQDKTVLLSGQVPNIGNFYLWKIEAEKSLSLSTVTILNVFIDLFLWFFYSSSFSCFGTILPCFVSLWFGA